MLRCCCSSSFVLYLQWFNRSGILCAIKLGHRVLRVSRAQGSRRTLISSHMTSNFIGGGCRRAVLISGPRFEGRWSWLADCILGVFGGQGDSRGIIPRPSYQKSTPASGTQEGCLVFIAAKLALLSVWRRAGSCPAFCSTLGELSVHFPHAPWPSRAHGWRSLMSPNWP